MNSRLMALVDARLHRLPVVATAVCRKVKRKICKCAQAYQCSSPVHWWHDISSLAQSRRAKLRWHGNGLIDLGPRDRKICRLADRGFSLSRIGRRFNLTRQRCGQIRRQYQSQSDILAFDRGRKCLSLLISSPSSLAPSSLTTHTGEGDNWKRRGHCVDNERHVNLFIAGGRV